MTTLAHLSGQLSNLRHELRSLFISDYVDGGVPVLARMHQKRLAGYRAMGYTVDNEPGCTEPLTF